VAREAMDYDVVIVGAGPAGLSAAIRLRQLAAEAERDLSVCVVEKGAAVGDHILSGAVLEPRALDELIPDWKQREAPVRTEVQDDRFLFLTAANAVRLPGFALPRDLKNHGNYIISLGNLCRWLATQAEALGVEIYPGFAAASALCGEDGVVRGVVTGDKGLARDGSHKAAFEPGIELRAKYTLFAEGCRGSISKTLYGRFDLGAESDPQTYGLGIKELWRVDSAQHQPGLVVHTAGWPMDMRTYGGSFLYHLEDSQVAVGFVVALDYRNPHLSPFDEFQRFKTHPAVRPTFEGGERLAYGARAINEGGLQSIPKLVFPGGALIGCSAGFLNVAKIKGTHTAMKSGMLAAEAAYAAIAEGREADELAAYPDALARSWVHAELSRVRNFRPGFRFGLVAGTLNGALELTALRGRAPWTRHHGPDHTRLKPAGKSRGIEYPKPDGVISFDRTSSAYLANTSHDEDQPVHLQLRRPETAIDHNLALYDAPEQRYCPAGVYEILHDEGGTPRLQINTANCVHCKTCDIKDPTQNIDWVTPEGGSGPNYPNM
jgi:electron-transferring-flavoprotein dehydrogenase